MTRYRPRHRVVARRLFAFPGPAAHEREARIAGSLRGCHARRGEPAAAVRRRARNGGCRRRPRAPPIGVCTGPWPSPTPSRSPPPCWWPTGYGSDPGSRSPTSSGVLVGAPLVMVVIYQAFHLYDAYRYTPAEEFRRIILAVSMGLFARPRVGVLVEDRLLAAVARRLLGARHRGGARIQAPVAQADRSRPSQRDPGVPHRGGRDERRGAAPGRSSCSFLPSGSVRSAWWRPGRETSDTTGPDFPVLGSVAQLREVIREVGAECVFVASSALSAQEMGYVAKAVRLEGRGGPRDGHAPRGPVLPCCRAVTRWRHGAVPAARPAHRDPGAW